MEVPMPDPRITNAKSLEELKQAIQDIGTERLTKRKWDDNAYDQFNLPTFGGAPMHGADGVYSWDEKNVLMGDTPTDAEIISREEYLSVMGEEGED